MFGVLRALKYMMISCYFIEPYEPKWLNKIQNNIHPHTYHIHTRNNNRPAAHRHVLLFHFISFMRFVWLRLAGCGYSCAAMHLIWQYETLHMWYHRSLAKLKDPIKIGLYPLKNPILSVQSLSLCAPQRMKAIFFSILSWIRFDEGLCRPYRFFCRFSLVLFCSQKKLLCRHWHLVVWMCFLFCRSSEEWVTLMGSLSSDSVLDDSVIRDRLVSIAILSYGFGSIRSFLYSCVKILNVMKWNDLAIIWYSVPIIKWAIFSDTIYFINLRNFNSFVKGKWLTLFNIINTCQSLWAHYTW